MTEKKFGRFESIAIIVTVMMNHIILNLPKIIIGSTSSGAVLNTVFISLFALSIAFLISKLFKNFPHLDIFGVAKFLGGKWLKNLIRYCFFTLSYFCPWHFIKSFFGRITNCLFFKNYRTYNYTAILNFINCY